MYTAVRSTFIWSNGPSPEWHDFDYLRSAKSSRGVAISLIAVLWIAIADLCWPRTNISILYIAPLLLLAWTRDLKPLWRSAGLMMVLTYAIFFLKNMIGPGGDGPSYFDYRLVNRTFVAVMIIAMGHVLQWWIRWREEQPDLEVSEAFRHQEQQISATFAMLSCVPLILLIAAIDFLVPANYNLAILYPIPLFICGWTRSHRLLWGTFAVLLILTAAAHFLGLSSSAAGQELSLARNRILAGLGMTAVTFALSYWMGREDTTGS